MTDQTKAPFTEREIVIAVAEKVMGWTSTEADYCHYAWNPLTDPAAWEQVLNHMVELGWDWYLEWDTRFTNPQFEASFCRGSVLDETHRHASARASTKGRAICEAALKAVQETSA